MELHTVGEARLDVPDSGFHLGAGGAGVPELLAQKAAMLGRQPGGAAGQFATPAAGAPPGAQSFYLPPAGSLTGAAALVQQQTPARSGPPPCFNFMGGRCFRENCRFAHIGPGNRQLGGPMPPPQPAFTGVMQRDR